ncbi:unnamed protein product [Prunus armeniaca]|uniref:Uncharacterized protein n=1 Tax=Prunus armeniaca TaxID=36596 RepID=A0A6J5U9S2_PRUAR|nr:unnamed protein product [Prunus armeniaca]
MVPKTSQGRQSSLGYFVLQLLQMKPAEVLIESTRVLGQRIKNEALLKSLPKLVNSLSASTEGANDAAVAITTTDLVSKSVAIQCQVITTDAMVSSDVWRKMVQVAVNRSFNQITRAFAIASCETMDNWGWILF